VLDQLSLDRESREVRARAPFSIAAWRRRAGGATFARGARSLRARDRWPIASRTATVEADRRTLGCVLHGLPRCGRGSL